jgi:hypothetical protein
LAVPPLATSTHLPAMPELIGPAEDAPGNGGPPLPGYDGGADDA